MSFKFFYKSSVINVIFAVFSDNVLIYSIVYRLKSHLEKKINCENIQLLINYMKGMKNKTELTFYLFHHIFSAYFFAIITKVAFERIYSF